MSSEEDAYDDDYEDDDYSQDYETEEGEELRVSSIKNEEFQRKHFPFLKDFL